MLNSWVIKLCIGDYCYNIKIKPIHEYLNKDLKCEPYFSYNYCNNKIKIKTDSPDFFM